LDLLTHPRPDGAILAFADKAFSPDGAILAFADEGDLRLIDLGAPPGRFPVQR
jgi:hypothetical protein